MRGRRSNGLGRLAVSWALALAPALTACSGGGGGSGDAGAAALAPLTATLTAAPLIVSTGAITSTRQQIDVTLVLRNNTADVTFIDIEPGLATLAGTGNATLVSSGIIGANGLSVPPGGQLALVETFRADQAGTVTFARSLTAVDAASGAVIEIGPIATAAVEIQEPAALAVQVPAYVGAPPARTGDLFTIDVVVTNTGQATARDVTALIDVTDGAADLISGPTPAAADLGGGQSRAFRFAMRAAAQGDLVLVGAASGLDANHSLPADTAPSSPTAPVTIEASAALEVRVQASPSAVTVSQAIDIAVTVENIGDDDARDVTLTLALAPALAGALAPTPPILLGDLAIGAATTTAFTFTTQAAGSLRFDAGASGFSVGDGAAIAAPPATSATIAVEAPAALAAALAFDRASALEGEVVTATLTVTNTGGATAQGVAPSPTPPAIAASGATATLVTGPSPASQDIPGGSARAFVYTWNPALTAPPAAGSFTLSASASGLDQNLGTLVGAATATSPALAVQPRPAELTASIAVTPSSAPQDGIFTVTLTVANQGTSDALQVAPAVTAAGSNGGAASASGPASPATATVPAGGSVDFVLAFEADEVGQVTFSGDARGQDAGTSAPVASPLVTSGFVDITPGPPVVLAANPATGPASGGTLVTLTGQRFAAGMTVTVGGRAATKVQVLSATQATIRTPAAAAGLAAEVAATNPGGALSQPAQVFTYQPDTSAPTITAFVPASGEQGVPRNRRVVIAFSEAMDATSLGIAGPGQSAAAGNTGDLRVITFFGEVGGTATLGPDGRKLVFVPGNRLGRRITHSVEGRTNQGQLRDVHGHVLASYTGSPPRFSTTFRTGEGDDNGAPAVNGSTPSANAVGVPLDTTLEVRFSEPIDPLTLTPTAIVLERVSPSAQIPVTFNQSDECSRVKVDPHVILDPGASYRLRVTTQVRDLAQRPLGQEVVIAFTTTAGDQEAPVITRLTLSEVTPEVNGTGPAGGVLQVPTSGFTIDLAYQDTGGAGIDPGSLEVTNDRAIGGVAAGQSFAGDFTVTASGATLLVPSSRAFPSGANTLTARVRDQNGNLSAARSFAFQVVTPSNTIRPFETQQVWFLDFSRDLWTVTVSPSGGGGISVSAVKQANGIADFVEDLRAFGLNGTTVVQVAQPGGGTKSSNEVVQDLVKLRIRQRVSAHCGVSVDDQGVETRDARSANVSFRTTKPAGAGIPPGTSSVPRGQAAFSSMPIGGGAPSAFTIGTAFFDPQNPNEENNVDPFADPEQNRGLGVFVTEIYRVNVNGASFGSFRLAFDKLIPGRGQPVGSHPDDAVILEGGFDPNGAGVTQAQRTRHADVFLAIERFTQTVSATTVHECGHSMGLVANDAMPSGLYGNLPASFPGSNSGHIKLTGTAPFTGGATNLMAPSSTFDESIHPGTRFGSLNEAYLRERVLHGN